MSTLADRTIAALRTNHDDLSASVGGMSADDLARPSGAAEWTVAQVLSHLGSGAEIGLAVLRAALAGQDAPGQDFNESVWSRWNARGSREQADDFLKANAELVAAYESLDPGTRERLEVRLGFLPTPADVTLIAGMRLNEAALHTWDVKVAFDPRATVAPDAVEALTDLHAGPLDFMVGFIGKPDALDRRQATLRVETSEPERVLGLTLGETVGFSQVPDPADVVLSAPAEAWLRLLTGRLDPAHTPASVTVTGDGVTLDDLRRVFPGL
ncbi:maleylpyruvate isomerase family mycothiol-dependent enzyme [Streptosporangium roseum]|uniref:maleylpyruvate isomerase family mycothiol-dependent enzyme n=1 Tax=Streptosporangium roseum TaxID=2001 RepID=UPI003329EEDA